MMLDQLSINGLPSFFIAITLVCLEFDRVIKKKKKYTSWLHKTDIKGFMNSTAETHSQYAIIPIYLYKVLTVYNLCLKVDAYVWRSTQFEVCLKAVCMYSYCVFDKHHRHSYSGALAEIDCKTLALWVWWKIIKNTKLKRMWNCLSNTFI